MQTYNVKLESAVSTSFRCQRAADSLDIDSKAKSIHELSVRVDLETPYSVGLIVGSSGSGKSTLAREIFGVKAFDSLLVDDLSVIDQFPESMPYDECAEILTSVGLTSVPCWIRPAFTLSNGQRARAEAALSIASAGSFVTVVDEWTSVVDRTVAKVMSHCISKAFKRSKRRIVLVSCHRDVIEWLNPDWIIDCNSQSYEDRRSLHPTDRRRTEQLQFDIRECDKSSWKYFSKYHYLSDKLPGGKRFLYGLYRGVDQIGFLAYSGYMPARQGKRTILHFNRLVIHPDYAGMGLGIKFVTQTAYMIRNMGFRVRGKFSSVPVYRAMSKSSEWQLCSVDRQIGKMPAGQCDRGRSKDGGGFRTNVKTFSFEFIG